MGNGNHKSTLDNLLIYTTILSNLAVLSGIIFGVIQIRQNTTSEKRIIAIEAISQLESRDFLKAFARLKTVYKEKQFSDKKLLIDDLNYIMGIYERISLLYMQDLAERSILKSAICPQLKETITIIESLNYPDKYRVNFNDLISKVNCFH